MEHHLDMAKVTRGRPKLPPDQKKVLVSVLVEPEQRETIEALSQSTGRSLGDVHREALSLGLAALERKKRK